MTLHSMTYGDHGPVVVFCHGLFGQGRNWGTAAKLLSDEYRCVLLDMPNHGKSPWTDVVDYPTMADVVADHLREQLGGELPVTLVGHSMGGKIAMRIALTQPELVWRLVVADMAPAETERMSSFGPIFEAVNALPLEQVQRRDQADAMLAERIADPSVRALLLQSLRNDHGRWHWILNLAGLTRDARNLSAWPEIDARYDGPTLFVAGALSDYVRAADATAIKRLFPNSLKVSLKGAGHWLHSQQPEAFAATVRSFLHETDRATAG